MQNPFRKNVCAGNQGRSQQAASNMRVLWFCSALTVKRRIDIERSAASDSQIRQERTRAGASSCQHVLSRIRAALAEAPNDAVTTAMTLAVDGMWLE